MKENKPPQYCDSNDLKSYKELINNSKIKKIYSEGINNILKDVFSDFWMESTDKEMSGFYALESKVGRSILNNLNTNYNALCLITKAVNTQIDIINKSDKKFDFSQKEKRTIEEVKRLIRALDHFKLKIFTKKNEEFTNIIKVLKHIWDRGQKSEDNVLNKIEKFFGDAAQVEKVGGHGQKIDALKGIDIIIILDGKKNTAQIKPYSNYIKKNDKIYLNDTGNVKPYNTDWLIFINKKSSPILIFKNEPTKNQYQYVFNVDSLIYEIN